MVLSAFGNEFNKWTFIENHLKQCSKKLLEMDGCVKVAVEQDDKNQLQSDLKSIEVMTNGEDGVQVEHHLVRRLVLLGLLQEGDVVRDQGKDGGCHGGDLLNLF